MKLIELSLVLSRTVSVLSLWSYKMTCYLRELLWNTACWDCGDNLLPDEGPDTEEDTPDPLLKRQWSCRESNPAKLNDDDLERTLKNVSREQATWYIL